MKEKVIVFTTGGTIAMRHDPVSGGAVPAAGGAELVEAVPPLAEICPVEVREFSKETLNKQPNGSDFDKDRSNKNDIQVNNGFFAGRMASGGRAIALYRFPFFVDSEKDEISVVCVISHT
jgi:hypothetical protein